MFYIGGRLRTLLAAQGKFEHNPHLQGISPPLAEWKKGRTLADPVSLSWLNHSGRRMSPKSLGTASRLLTFRFSASIEKTALGRS